MPAGNIHIPVAAGRSRPSIADHRQTGEMKVGERQESFPDPEASQPETGKVNDMTSSHELAGLMERNVSDVFGQRDSARRQVAISEIYTEDPAFFDEQGQAAGRDAISAQVEDLFQQSPGFVFRIADPAQVIHDLGRLRWQFGPPDAPPVVTGMDVAVFARGKIRALYTFIESPDKG